MAVPLLDITLNDIALVLVWFLIAAVFSLVLYHTHWHEQRGLHASPATTPEQPEAKEEQPDTFLILDVEGTCVPGTGFDWPNEIIEWPVVLLKWQETTSDTPNDPLTNRALVAIDEFRSFVRPTWKPQLHPFCTQLTGITQAQVDAAPTFPDVMRDFEQWLMKHKLLTKKDKQLRMNVVFATDGPWDLRDFAVKSFHLSRCPKPSWFPQAFIDIRALVSEWYVGHHPKKIFENQHSTQRPHFFIRPSFKLNKQLEVLGIGPFQGREHCGIDDTRNIGRVLAELGRRGMDLEVNSRLILQRWPWMGSNGTVVGFD